MPGLRAPGYACWPLLVGIAHVAASHRRSRVFILADADRAELEDRPLLPDSRRRACQLKDAAGGQLKPVWVDWLMGLPDGLPSFARSVTPSCPTMPE